MMAVQIVTSHEIDYFDVIILDINMPIMDGFQACKQISQFINFEINQSERSVRRAIVEPNMILNISLAHSRNSECF